MSRARVVLVLATAAAGCIDPLDPQWQLDHDRVVAVRAKPPHAPAGTIAKLDALIAHKGAPTDVEQPDAVTAAPSTPGDLFTAVNFSAGQWYVAVPDEAGLDAARAALALPAGAPVPLDLFMEFPPSNGVRLIAKKTLWLGDRGDNPAPPAPTLDGDGAPFAAPPIIVPRDREVVLAVDLDASWTASWLSSCGTLFDDDEHRARLRVQPNDRTSGELALIVRDPAGGVVWQVWPIEAAP